MKIPTGFNYEIVVIGCGGTGSQLLPMLMQLCSNLDDIVNITLVDGDIYERKNLANQRCILADVGKNKAKVSAERYSMIYPKLKISYYENYITDKIQIHDLFEGRDRTIRIIIGCVDNTATRKLLSEYSNKINKTIYIDSGNDSGKGSSNRDGQIVTGVNICIHENVYGRLSNMQYKLPNVADIYPEIKSNTDDIKTVGTCMRFSDDYPQNIATNMLAATLLMNTITNILMFNKIENHVTLFNADTLEVISRPPAPGNIMNKTEYDKRRKRFNRKGNRKIARSITPT